MRAQRIAQLRDELTFLLGTIPNSVVHRTVPESIAPPCYVLQPADPFVFEPTDDENTMREPFVISFDAMLLTRLDDEHDNEQASDQLDAMLDDLLDALAGDANAGEWWLESMGRPGGLLTTDWIAHGQRVTVRRRITL